MSLTVLYGPPGCLAPECARELSARLGRPFATVDAAIEALAGRPASHIAVENGPHALKRTEAEAVLALLHGLSAGDERILALGSGSLGEGEDPLFAPVRASLDGLRERGAKFVHLTADLATLAKRAGLDGPRPAALASPRRILFEQLARRAPLYERYADQTVDTSGRRLDDVVDELEANLR